MRLGTISTRKRYRALATDGDGTLLMGGRLAEATRESLDRFAAAGGTLLLVTGENLQDLKEFPHLSCFRLVVAENGGVCHDPATGRSERLGPPLPGRLAATLRRRGVAPLKIGEVSIGTKLRHRRTVLSLLRELGLDYRVVRNRKDVIILPPNVTKATGLAHALDRLGIDPCAVVAIGDAENDMMLLEECGLGVAVANAARCLKKQAERVTAGRFGKGVREVIDAILRAE